MSGDEHAGFRPLRHPHIRLLPKDFSSLSEQVPVWPTPQNEALLGEFLEFQTVVSNVMVIQPRELAVR